MASDPRSPIMAFFPFSILGIQKLLHWYKPSRLMSIPSQLDYLRRMSCQLFTMASWYALGFNSHFKCLSSALKKVNLCLFNSIQQPHVTFVCFQAKLRLFRGETVGVKEEGAKSPLRGISLCHVDDLVDFLFYIRAVRMIKNKQNVFEQVLIRHGFS